MYKHKQQGYVVVWLSASDEYEGLGGNYTLEGGVLRDGDGEVTLEEWKTGLTADFIESLEQIGPALRKFFKLMDTRAQGCYHFALLR